MERQKINIKVNKSKIYFTPIFNRFVPIQHFNLLKNTYFWYDNFKEDVFCLLYKFDGRVTGSHNNRRGFTVYENDVLFAHDLLRGYRDYDEYVIYEFSLNDELIDFRNELIQGRYSKIKEKDKSTIIEFNLRMYGPNDADYISRVLNRDEELINNIAEELNVNPKYIPEASSSIDLDSEMFSNSVINININRENYESKN